MAMRVATFATSDSLLKAAMRVQAQEAEATVQEASGQKSTDYAGLGRDSTTLVSLNASITRSKAYQDAANTANTRVQAMYDAVGSMVDTLTNALSDAINTDLTTTGNDVLASTASSALDDIISQLNSQYDGNYLFSGTATDTEPVDLTNYSTSDTDASGYYQGNNDSLSAKVSSTRTVTYGTTADNTAFQKAIRALSLLASGDADDDTITEAQNLLNDAIDGLSDIQGSLSVKSSTLENAVDTQDTYQSTASDFVSDIASVDVATVAAKISTYKTQLEAAYSAIGTISSLSLQNYLK